MRRILESALGAGCAPLRLAPRQSLLPRGATADSLYILLSGRLRATFPNDRTELTLGIFDPGEVFTSMESFMEGSPSEYAIEAVEDSEVILVGRPVLERLLQEEPRLAMDLLAHHRRFLALLSRRVMELLVASPKERYLRFEREHPDLIEQLPLYMVASLIGIAPESLSRIRRRLAVQLHSPKEERGVS